MSEKKSINWKKEVLDYVKTIAIAVIVVLLLINFIVRPVKVKGNSMYPTLNNNDLGFTSIISLQFEKIKRFDVVTIQCDLLNEQLVKRVIGLPGETVKYENDVLYINDLPVAEDFFDIEYVESQKSTQEDKLFTKDFGPVTLGDDEYLCLGDNRLNSYDSRKMGAFSRKDILSKSIVVWWPINHWTAE